MKQIYLNWETMAQDKYIKQHQDKLEKLRNEIREQKMDILDKIDIDLILSSPREHLKKIAEDFYNNNENKLKESFESGKKLGKQILKGLK